MLNAILRLSTLALLAVATGELTSQPAPQANVRLYLETQDGRAVAQASLRLHRAGREYRAQFDSAGRVRLIGVPSGKWTADVRHIGLQKLSVELTVGSGENSYVLIATEQPITMASVLVTDNSVAAARHSEFEARRTRGIPNAVLTRQEIERRNVSTLSQLLRGLPGLRLGDSLGVAVAISNRGPKPSRIPNGPGFALVQCVMRVTLDGILLPPLTDLNNIIPNEIYGIELYYGSARMPPELSGLRTDNWCGLIAVWTR